LNSVGAPWTGHLRTSTHRVTLFFSPFQVESVPICIILLGGDEFSCGLSLFPFVCRDFSSVSLRFSLSGLFLTGYFYSCFPLWLLISGYKVFPLVFLNRPRGLFFALRTGRNEFSQDVLCSFLRDYPPYCTVQFTALTCWSGNTNDLSPIADPPSNFPIRQL